MPYEESPTPPECFICTESEPAPRRSACKCTDRYVHDACLVKMLETSTHVGCPVCATPYANVSCTSRLVGVRVWSHGVCALAVVVVSPALLWGACVTWHIYTSSFYKMSLPEEQFVIICAIIMAIGGAMGIAWLGRECLIFGPAAIARTALVHKRTARVSATMRARPPRIRAEEFELATALPR